MSQQTELQAWMASRPKRVQAAIKRYPPTNCYKAKDNPGHYELYSYEEPKNKRSPITVKIIHLWDSYLPNTVVFGVNPKTLIPCGCRTN